MDVLNRKHLPVSAVSGASVVFGVAADTSVVFRIYKTSKLCTLRILFFSTNSRYKLLTMMIIVF